MAQIDSVFEFQWIGGSIEFVAKNDVAMYGGVEDTYSQELNTGYDDKPDLFDGYQSGVSDDGEFRGGALFDTDEDISSDITPSNTYEELFGRNSDDEMQSMDSNVEMQGYSSSEDIYDLLGGMVESDEEPNGVISF